MKTRSIKRLLFVLVPGLLVCVLAFKLFEPVFVYNWGWKELPAGDYPAATVRSRGWEEVGAQADAWLLDVRAGLATPALSAAVLVDGELAWAGGAGFADLDSRRAVTLRTAFRIGSSSKPVTSIAMGVLIGEQAVDLDAPVSHYVPDLGGPLASITTRQAMSHLGGVRDYGLCLCFPIWEYYNRTHYSSQRDALRPFERSDLLFSPGSSFFYSSYGYNLAGAVIERVAGQRFGDFLERRLFDPLGMDGTHVDTGTREPQDATFYELRDGTYKPAFRVDNTNKLPSGGILSTPTDMVRLGQQAIVPSLFSVGTRDELIRHQPLADGRVNPQGYALGWRSHELSVLRGTRMTRVLHHHGVAYGAVSHFSVYPEYGAVVSVMMNRNQGSFGDAPARLADLFLNVLDARHGTKAAVP
jgi:CubicO group peptidase (beta-lactamase class C family)